MSRVQAAIDQAEVYLSSHSSRSHLWTDDRSEFLRQFLKYGHVPSEEELEAAGTLVHISKPLYIATHIQHTICLTSHELFTNVFWWLYAGDEGLPETPPTLDNFKQQINSYEQVYGEVDKIEGTEVIDRWFRVDARPFKQALLTTIKRWSLLFKQHLIDHVRNR